MIGKAGAAGMLVAAVAAIALAAFGMARGTWSVGGSDSSCYALTAQAMADGRLQPLSALAVEAPWPNAPLTLAPGGFIPSPVRRDGASPICAPGMSVLMAPLVLLFGADGLFWLVPLSGALLVGASFIIARHMAGAMAGAVAAILIASSPIVLYQVVQPMNDVLTASLWMAAIAALIHRRGLLAGAILGMAILVRPNLAPLAIMLAAIPFAVQHERPLRSTAMMLAAAIPGVFIMFVLNSALYGSVFGSGYGSASQLFSVSNIDRNLATFGRGLLETQFAVPAIALAAPLLFSGPERRLSLVLLAASAGVIAIYLLYQPYPEWWYLRFLMPASALLLILASAVIVRAATRARMGGVVPIAAVVVAIFGVRVAGDRQAFELQRMEGRYREAAHVVADRLPANAVLITVWQSGSVRFHANRDAVLWDSMEPAWLDRSVEWLRLRGLQPYFLFERREEGDFRSRFRGHSEFGALDWPPRIDINRQTRIYDPADRARFLAGDTYSTDNNRSR